MAAGAGPGRVVVKARVAAVVVPTSKSKIPLHSRRSVASEHIHPTSVGYTIALQLVLLVDKKTYDLRSMSQWRANIFYSVYSCTVHF